MILTQSMKIIGHRGAAGLALENTIEAIKAGVEAGADGIEIDVRRTTDGHLVLCHDKTTGRVGSRNLEVSKHTLKELQSFKLKNGEHLPTLEDALKATAGKATLVIEGKGHGWAAILIDVLQKNARKNSVAVISFNYQELKAFHKQLPDIPVYALASVDPFRAISVAKNNGFAGVDLGYWLVHPLTSVLARWAGLEVFTFTINNFLLAKYMAKLHPGIAITTNYPDKLRSKTR